MYSWGDDTKNWKSPGAYDYGSARAPYLDDLKKEAAAKGSERSYSKKKAPNLDLVDPNGKTISSDSEDPVILAVDGTGSMKTWPAEIFDRLPLLYQTLSKYKPCVDISFSVIGDANSDQWPVQISNFGKGPTLDDYLKALQPEGGGGPGIRESYELWAYFMMSRCTTPNAKDPFMIIMGDEKFYDTINPAQVKKHLGVTTQALDAVEVWKELGQRYDIRFLRKENDMPGKNPEIIAKWEEALGPGHIVPVYDPMRVVDVAMGLIAQRWGNFGDFKTNLSARQDAGGIEAVMTSLRAAPGLPPGMKSKLKLTAGSKKSTSLLEG
ncbi:MAG: hypothetical protein AABX70_08440 [Nanoarchaeota archaeon]